MVTIFRHIAICNLFWEMASLSASPHPSKLQNLSPSHAGNGIVTVCGTRRPWGEASSVPSPACNPHANPSPVPVAHASSVPVGCKQVSCQSFGSRFAIAISMPTAPPLPPPYPPPKRLGGERKRMRRISRDLDDFGGVPLCPLVGKCPVPCPVCYSQKASVFHALGNYKSVPMCGACGRDLPQKLQGIVARWCGEPPGGNGGFIPSPDQQVRLVELAEM